MVVTVTATNPTATTGSDGGDVVVTLTETVETSTDSTGGPSYVVQVSRLRVDSCFEFTRTNYLVEAKTRRPLLPLTPFPLSPSSSPLSFVRRNADT